MKNILRFLLMVSLVFSSDILLPAQWSQTNGPFRDAVRSFALSPGNLFVGTSTGVYRSTDNGARWDSINTGLISTNIYDVKASGAYIFSSDVHNVYRSTNNGTSWSVCLNKILCSCIAVFGENIFVGTYDGGIYRSTNYGTNWTTMNSGLYIITSIAVLDSTLFVGGNIGEGVIRSTDNGTSWTNVGMTNIHVFSYTGSDTNLFAASWSGHIFRSTNKGINWSLVNTIPTSNDVRALVYSGTNLFAATYGNGIFLSTDNGASWTVKSSGLANNFVTSLALNDTTLIAGMDGGNISFSVDSGATWILKNAGLKTTNAIIKSLTTSGSSLVAGTYYDGIFLSTNNGTHWIKKLSSNLSEVFTALTVLGTNIFAGSGSSVYLSTDNGANWNSVYTSTNGMPNDVNTLAVLGTNLFAGTSTGVYRSTDNGANWDTVNTGLTNYNINCFAVSGINIFAGSYGGVFLSTDNGSNWTSVNTGLPASSINSLIASGVNLFVGTEGNGIYRSTDNGLNWNVASVGVENTVVKALVVSEANLYAGIYGSGVYYSSNNGTSWSAVNSGLTEPNVYAFAVSGSTLFAGTTSGVFRTDQTALPVEVISFDLKQKGSTVELLWATVMEVDNYGFEIERSRIQNTEVSNQKKTEQWLKVGFIEGNGTSNAPKEYSFSDSNVGEGKYLYRLKQIDRDGQFKYSKELELMIGVVPKDFILKQNYPNPFNPTTTIRYSLPTSANVKIVVYDLLGREIETLVNEVQSAGWKEVEWNAADFSSGIYFYKLHVGSFVEVKKMLMSK